MFEFYVTGRPIPAGSKTARAIRYKLENIPAHDTTTCRACGFTGLFNVHDVSDQRGKDWRRLIQAQANHCRLGRKLENQPLVLEVNFYLERPKNHYRTGRFSEELSHRAPPDYWIISTPDTTKLIRAVEDALNGVIWGDDSLVVDQTQTKRYCCRYRQSQGALIRVAPYTPAEDETHPELEL